jgi:hypothetical protein
MALGKDTKRRSSQNQIPAGFGEIALKGGSITSGILEAEMVCFNDATSRIDGRLDLEYFNHLSYQTVSHRILEDS